ncbi:unnamed protein product [Chironomus riparius]|uniref:Uncharacterized protein n=1 Tax=Chironomus riparius TaxID=315576 RepID=A0A9N9S6V6_9DIPT|nr:unnamed protein product [Chironomus riparius]
MDKICDNNPTMNEIMEHKDGTSECHDNNNSNLKLICIENCAEGLGIKLSKSSWDPYPFISFVDETREQQHDLQIGDCLLKVNGQDVLGWRIQEIAEQIHNKTDDDNNEVNLLLWRARNSQQGYQPQLFHNLISDVINILQMMECPICMEIPQSPSYTYQCVNGHIVCEKCRWKIIKCPTCRVQLGRGRCLIADKILHYMQNNSMIKIGGSSCDIGKNMSKKIDDRSSLRASGNDMEDDNKTTTQEGNLHVKRSCLPFKFKFRSVTFWRNST